MYHTIEFSTEVVADVEVSRKQPLEKVRISKGTRVRAELKPHVIETENGLIEVADLFFQDGTVTRRMPFDNFILVD